MARRYLEARDLIATRLNNRVLDPYPGVRNGKHFLNESDGINLSRANTFPKGYIFGDDDEPFPKLKIFYKSGFNKRTAKFNIYYLVKDRISYTDIEGRVYKEMDYLHFMKDEILEALQYDLHLGEGYYIDNIYAVPQVQELTSDEFPFKIYQQVITITIKWVNKYGSA